MGLGVHKESTPRGPFTVSGRWFVTVPGPPSHLQSEGLEVPHGTGREVFQPVGGVSKPAGEMPTMNDLRCDLIPEY